MPHVVEPRSDAAPVSRRGRAQANSARDDHEVVSGAALGDAEAGHPGVPRLPSLWYHHHVLDKSENTVKRTYSLSAATVDDFEAAVRSGERSAIVEHALREWLDARKRDALRRGVIEGCREMSEVYLSMEKDYHPLEEELHRALEAEPQPRIGGPRPSRSRRRVRAGG